MPARLWRRTQLRPGMMVGRPAGGCRPSSSGYQARLRREPGAGAVQPVWRSCRVGRDRAPGMALRKPGE